LRRTVVAWSSSLPDRGRDRLCGPILGLGRGRPEHFEFAVGLRDVPALSSAWMNTTLGLSMCGWNGVRRAGSLQPQAQPSGSHHPSKCSGGCPRATVASTLWWTSWRSRLLTDRPGCAALRYPALTTAQAITPAWRDPGRPWPAGPRDRSWPTQATTADPASRVRPP